MEPFKSLMQEVFDSLVMLKETIIIVQPCTLIVLSQKKIWREVIYEHGNEKNTTDGKNRICKKLWIIIVIEMHINKRY